MQKKYDEMCFLKAMEYVKDWSWQELYWGFQNDIIIKKDIIDYAKHILDDGIKSFDIVLEVSIAEEYEDIDQYLESLIDLEDKQDEYDIKDKWRYVILQDLFNNRTKYEDVYENVENIYADFDYPEDMAGFIRYMPSNGGETLEESWERYLRKAEERFN